MTKNTAVQGAAAGVRRRVRRFVASPATQSDESPLVAAMKDELARSMSELRIKDEPPPYYIEYHVDETVTMRTAARLGAIEVNDRDSRLRTLEVEVRVGDYQFDSSRFVVSQGRGGFSPQGEGSAVTTLDDNYDAIRRQLWLATDAAYKRAVNTFARKKAAFQNRATNDPLPDFSQETPVSTIRSAPPRPAAPIDWAQRARDLSAVLRASPDLQSSAVSVAEQYGTHYFLNSEGFMVVTPIEDATFVVSADAQADDGMTLRASYRISENRLEHMPPVDALMAATRAIGERLTAERTAPLGEEFTGPVLFEGRAGAEVLAQSFVPLLLATRAPDSDNPRFARQPSTPFLTRIGLRVMSESFSVSDTPSLTRFGRSTRPRRLRSRRPRRPSEGCAARRERPAADAADQSDAQPQPARVERPRPRKRSPGRRRAGAERPRDSGGRDEEEVSGAAEDSEQGVRLHRPQPGHAVDAAHLQGHADGAEQMVRGVNLADVPPTAFRDILEASSELTLLTYRTGGGPVSVIAPALLFEELEIEEVTDILQKPPIVPSPLRCQLCRRRTPR